MPEIAKSAPKEQLEKEICMDLRNSPTIAKMQKDFLISLHELKVVQTEEALRKLCFNFLSRRNVANRIRNEISHYVMIRDRRTERSNANQDTLWNMHMTSNIAAANDKWAKKINKGVVAMAEQIKVSLKTKRSTSGKMNLCEKWEELSSVGELETPNLRAAYSPKDLLDFIQITLSNNQEHKSEKNDWMMLKEPSTQLQSKFRMEKWRRGLEGDLGLEVSQLGLDGDLDSKYAKQCQLQAHQVLQFGDSTVGAHFCRRGCPPHLRGQMWCLALAVCINIEDYGMYEMTKQNLLNYDSIVTRLLFKDIRDTTSNDDNYFVFEDLVHQVLLPGLYWHKENDSWVKGRVLPWKSVDQNSAPQIDVPVHGLSYLVSPLAYCFSDKIHLGKVFRALNDKLFFHLTDISVHSQSILNLAIIFEEIISKYEPQLVDHFNNRNIQPLKIAFKWMVRAFSGVLRSDQVLELWDRLIGFSDLTLLPVLAVSIMAYRSESLYQSNSQSEAELMLSDLTSVSVIPLLQSYIYM